jgi:hypothetical protein
MGVQATNVSRATLTRSPAPAQNGEGEGRTVNSSERGYYFFGNMSEEKKASTS